MAHYLGRPIREEIQRINKDQKGLNPHTSRIQTAVISLFNAQQKFLGSNVEQPSFDYATDNHFVIGNIFPDFAERLTLAMRSAGLKAGADFTVQSDESSKAAAGARKVLIHRDALKQSQTIAAAIDRSREELFQHMPGKK